MTQHLPLFIDPMTVAKMPSRFIHDVEATADRLVFKAKQLVHNKTTLDRHKS